MSIEKKPKSNSSGQQLLVAAIDRVFDELSEGARVSDSNLFFNQMADRLVELFPECRFLVRAGLESKTVVINRCGEHFKTAENDATTITQPISEELEIGFGFSKESNRDRDHTRVLTEVLREAANIGREHFANGDRSSGASDFHDRLFEFTNRCHSSLELKTVATHLVNGGEKLLGADRVWLFSSNGSDDQIRPELLACSSVSEVDSRSEDLELVKGVVLETVRLGKSTFSSFDEIDSLADDRTSTIDYLNRFKSNGLYACLLNVGSPADVLIVECFESHDRLQLAQRLAKLPIAARPALANAREHESIPFRKTLKRFSPASRIRAVPWKRILALASLFALIATFFVKIDFEIPVEGSLKPVNTREVFASADGTVTSIFVDYGRQVHVGEELLTIHSGDYELKLNQTQGELLSANKELESVQLLRRQASESGDALKVGQLTSQIEQVTLKIRSLNEKSDFYLKQVAALKVVAPIDGKITTEKTKQLLMDRPIRAGDPLVSIAEIDGDWHAELEIKSVDLSYLNSSNDQERTVRFRSLASIQQQHEGLIKEIDGFNSIDENGDVSVRAFVPIVKSDFEHLRVGTPITGTINCGRRTIAFVWTREIRDLIRTHFFWF